MAPTLRSRDKLRAQKSLRLPVCALPRKKHKSTTQQKMETRACIAKKSAGVQLINCVHSPLLRLPAEIRLRIYQYATTCPSGPEVFVGVGSHEPTKSMRTFSPGPLALLSSGAHRQDWADLNWFRSNITGYDEVVRSICTQLARTSMDSPSYNPVGMPVGLRRPKYKPAPLTGDRERHWPIARQNYLRPFLACKTLYHEAQEELFKNRHFILGSSTYALAWLRKIGGRNAMNIRSVRFKIHREFYSSTGKHAMEGLCWDEVLNRLRRLAPGLRVLGLHYEEGHARLEDAQRFLHRAQGFSKLCRVDLYVWGLDTYAQHPFLYNSWCRSSQTRGEAPAEINAMMESFVHQTRIPIRRIEICRFLLQNSKCNASLSGREWYLPLHIIRAGQDGGSSLTTKDERVFRFINAYEACLHSGA